MSHSRYIPLRKNLESGPKDAPSVQKGGTDALRISKADIEKTIIYLKNNANILVKEANTDLKAELNILYTYVSQLYNTESYSDFYKIIVRHFGELTTITPGSVAAVCYGCSNIKGLPKDSQSCAAACIDGIPPPKMPSWAICDNTVAILFRDEGKSTLKVLQKKENTFAYIYMITGEKDPNAKLTREEYELLLNERIHEYHLFNYNNSYYLDMSLGVVEVPTLVATTDGPKTSHSTSGSLKSILGAPKVSFSNSSRSKFLKLARSANFRKKGQGFVIGGILLLIFIVIIFVAIAASKRRR